MGRSIHIRVGRAEGYVRVKPLGPMPIMGLAASAGGLTRFAGRNRELDQLSQALERASTEQGQIVAVVGEAGLGKSRLYLELTTAVPS